MSALTNWCVFFVLNSAWQLVVLFSVGCPSDPFPAEALE